MAVPKADDISSWLGPNTPWRSRVLFFRSLETDCRPVRIQTNTEKLRRAQTALGCRENRRSGRTRFQAFRCPRGGAVGLERSKRKRKQGHPGKKWHRCISSHPPDQRKPVPRMNPFDSIPFLKEGDTLLTTVVFILWTDSITSEYLGATVKQTGQTEDRAKSLNSGVV